MNKIKNLSMVIFLFLLSQIPGQVLITTTDDKKIEVDKITFQADKKTLLVIKDKSESNLPIDKISMIEEGLKIINGKDSEINDLKGKIKNCESENDKIKKELKLCEDNLSELRQSGYNKVVGETNWKLKAQDLQNEVDNLKKELSNVKSDLSKAKLNIEKNEYTAKQMKMKDSSPSSKNSISPSKETAY